MSNLKKSTIIECVASTPDRDVAGETIDIAGADISPLTESRGFVNSDHKNDFAHLVGRVLEAKKILKAEDATTPNQMKYWNDLKKPFIWTKAEIFDGHGHKEADSIASIYNFYQARSEPPPIKVSVEGKTLERGIDGNLKRTLIKGIALTVVPCNRQTRTEVVQVTKSLGWDADSLVKSDDAVPSFYEMADDSPYERVLNFAIKARAMVKELSKALTKTENETEIKLKSPALLERLKTMTASLKK